MDKKIFNIVSGAKSGALNVALMIGDYLQEQGFQVQTVLRKYNKTDFVDSIVIKDRCTIDYIIGLAKLIKEAKPDFIVVHGYSTHLWTKMAVAYAKVKVKLIHVEHNVEKYTPLRKWLLKKLDRHTARYVCVSKGVASHLIKQGIDKEKVCVIYNGIDIEKFNLPKVLHAVYTIGMTARFSKQKDQMTLIKAVENLIGKGIPIKLILIGTGKTKRRCEAYVKEKRLQEAIVFMAGKFEEIIPELDLFVLSTHYEGFGLVVVEAMAAKIPVIATEVVGVNEIITHGKDGYLVRENDVDDLTERIMALKDIHNTVKEQEMTVRAFKMVCKNFAKDHMLHSYLKLILKE